MNDLDTGWVGWLDPDADVDEIADRLTRRTAARLGVPAEQVEITEHPDPSGVELRARWVPPT